MSLQKSTISDQQYSQDVQLQPLSNCETGLNVSPGIIKLRQLQTENNQLEQLIKEKMEQRMEELQKSQQQEEISTGEEVEMFYKDQNYSEKERQVTHSVLDILDSVQKRYKVPDNDDENNLTTLKQLYQQMRGQAIVKKEKKNETQVATISFASQHPKQQYYIEQKALQQHRDIKEQIEYQHKKLTKDVAKMSSVQAELLTQHLLDNPYKSNDICSFTTAQKTQMAQFHQNIYQQKVNAEKNAFSMSSVQDQKVALQQDIQLQRDTMRKSYDAPYSLGTQYQPAFSIYNEFLLSGIKMPDRIKVGDKDKDATQQARKRAFYLMKMKEHAQRVQLAMEDIINEAVEENKLK